MQVANNMASRADWSSSYANWNTYCKDLNVDSDEPKKETAKSGPQLPSHCFDHEQERAIFEKSEDEKISLCERHRIMVPCINFNMRNAAMN